MAFRLAGIFTFLIFSTYCHCWQSPQISHPRRQGESLKVSNPLWSTGGRERGQWSSAGGQRSGGQGGSLIRSWRPYSLAHVIGCQTQIPAVFVITKHFFYFSISYLLTRRREVEVRKFSRIRFSNAEQDCAG